MWCTSVSIILAIKHTILLQLGISKCMVSIMQQSVKKLFQHYTYFDHATRFTAHPMWQFYYVKQFYHNSWQPEQFFQHFSESNAPNMYT